MKNTNTIWQIRMAFTVLAAILLFAWSANTASADEGSSLSVAPTGQVIVKNAVVVSASGGTIVAKTGWGEAALFWTVQTSGSTRFVPDIGSAEAMRRIEPGHTVSFSGMLIGSIARPTVNASVLKDTDLVQESASVVGTVKSVDLESNSFVLSSQDVDTTIFVPSGALMSKDGGYMRISDIAVGDAGKATGTLDTESRTLTASRISIRTPEAAPEVAEAPRDSVFASILTWLKGSRGILSVRDR